MSQKRDYYEVLGLAKGASTDEIKSAYKRAALKWHPDRHVNDSEADKKAAEEKFKEATEAYSVLSDPQKRAQYDKYGHAAENGGFGGGFGGFGGGFGGIDLDDLLSNLFGGANPFGGGNPFSNRGSQGRRTLKGRDIRTRVRVTLEEIARGCEKSVQLRRDRPCSECGGKGSKNSSDVKECPTCHGSGQVESVSTSFFGRTISYSTCPHCKGTGKVVTNPCHKCNGTGLETKVENVSIKIPMGVSDGMQLRLRGEGHSAPFNGINGDLQVVIEEIPHDKLKRDGINLFYTHIVSLDEAILGAEIEIPTLEGVVKKKLEPGTQSGTVITLRGKGICGNDTYGRLIKGDLYVKIIVWIPRRLDKKSRQAIEEMAKNGELKPNPSREDKQLFEKESKYF